MNSSKETFMSKSLKVRTFVLLAVTFFLLVVLQTPTAHAQSYTDYNFGGDYYTDYSFGGNGVDLGDGCCGYTDYNFGSSSAYTDYNFGGDYYTDYNFGSSYTDYNFGDYYPSYTPNYYPSYTPSYDYDYGYYPSYSYYSPSYAYYQPQRPIYHTPSSNYSYYNNVQSTVNNNIDNSVVTNTNINTNTTPSYPSYPTYYPPVQYSYPRVVQAAPTVTVSGTRYVHINQVPYTGTEDVAYVLMLIAAALAGGAFFFREQLIGGLRNAYATATGQNDHFFFDEVPAEEVDDSIAIGDTQEGSNSLAITRGADGPKLSFVQR